MSDEWGPLFQGVRDGLLVFALVLCWVLFGRVGELESKAFHHLRCCDDYGVAEDPDPCIEVPEEHPGLDLGPRL